MLKTILIDDETAALDSLKKELKKYCHDSVDVVQTCDSPLEGLKAIKKYQPDLVFLDVKMRGMTGFELLDFLNEINFCVVFVSAFDEYALQAFKASAIHFLLKPIDKNELIESVGRVKSMQQKVSNEQLEVLIQNLNPQRTLHKIAIQTNNGFVFISSQNIKYCNADNGGTDIYLSEKVLGKEKISSSKKMMDIQELLPKDTFFRVHHSHIVNREFVLKYNLGESNSVIVEGGEIINVARSKKKEFSRWLGLSAI